MMRHYRSYTPGKPLTPTREPLTESFENWKARHSKNSEDSKSNTETDSEVEEEKNMTDTDERAFFHLKTESGEVKYKPSDYGNHTDFLRAVIEIAIAFNSPEVDPEFKKVIRRALSAYENGEELGELDEFDDEDEDLVIDALEAAKQQAQKMEEASKLTSNLPKTEKLRLQILSTEDSNTKHIGKLLAKHTDLPPVLIDEALKKNVPFIMPSEKGKELYVQLRMLDVTLSVKPVDEIVSQQAPATKKAAAAKKSAKTSSKAKPAAKAKSASKSKIDPTKIFPVTGREKLKQTDGIINA